RTSALHISARAPARGSNPVSRSPTYAKKPVFPCSPSVTTSTPCAACWRTASVTAAATGPSSSLPRSPLPIRSSNGPGRGRLPRWGVGWRSVLRFLVSPRPGSQGSSQGHLAGAYPAVVGRYPRVGDALRRQLRLRADTLGVRAHLDYPCGRTT